MEREGDRTATAGWRREAVGPALVLAAALGVALVSRFVGRIPNPPAVLLLFVVFAAFHGGVRAGLVSAVIACGYFAIAFSRPGQLWSYTDDDLRRIVVWSLAVPVMAVMVGTLKARAVAAERAASQAAEARFITAFHASPVGVILTRLVDSRMVDINDAALAILGYDRADVIGATAVDLGLWRDPAQRATVVDRLRVEGRLQNLDVEVDTKAAGPASVLASIELVTVGADTCMLSFLVDITARRRADESLRRREEALRKTQNLEALGRLAGGVAHDFNNLLTVIGGNAELLAGIATDPAVRDLASEIVTATGRAASLTRQLLDFSRPQPQAVAAVDLSAAVAGLQPMLARTLGEDIELVTELGAALGVARINPGQLDRVIMNLVLNARDAMPTGGTLTITSERIVLDADAAALRSPHAVAGAWLVLTVGDTGEGMDAPTRGRIFEPFFTTKAVGGGSGLGLTTVHAIVTAAGGFITVYSEPGRGAAFSIHLPVAAAVADASDDPAPTSAGGHGEVVLVVEDDAAVRALTGRLVAELGYRVLVADGGAQALDLLGREPRAVAAIVTDVIMPGMNGTELIERVLLQRPGVKVVFVSGYANDGKVGQMLRRGQLEFLPKPFTRDELARALRDLLAPTAAAAIVPAR